MVVRPKTAIMPWLLIVSAPPVRNFHFPQAAPLPLTESPLREGLLVRLKAGHSSTHAGGTPRRRSFVSLRSPSSLSLAPPLSRKQPPLRILSGAAAAAESCSPFVSAARSLPRFYDRTTLAESLRVRAAHSDNIEFFLRNQLDSSAKHDIIFLKQKKHESI